MEIILHLGAHRTATTSFQHYMGANAATLTAQGLGVWGPDVTRDGILTGVIPLPGGESARRQMDRARGRIALRLAQARKAGLRRIVVSDENMIGAARRNLRQGRLYDSAGERMARFAHAFDGNQPSGGLDPGAGCLVVLGAGLWRGARAPPAGGGGSRPAGHGQPALA